jgi:HEXXH motif-containing protein
MSFSCFSSPETTGFKSAADHLAARFCFSTRVAVERAAASDGLPPLPATVRSASPGAPNRWRSEVGAVRLALGNPAFRDRSDWLRAQFLIAEYLDGLVHELELVLEESPPLFLAGHVVEGTRLLVHATADSLVVSDGVRTPKLVLERFAAPGVSPVWVESRESVVRVGSGSLAVFSNGEWERRWYPESTMPQVAGDRARNRAILEEACAILEELQPGYYLWIALLLREIVPIRGVGGDATTSQSSAVWPGHVHISASSIVQTIIMLIHECSHQYFHMLQWCTGIVKEGAPPVFSVVKDTRRPLDKVLLAHHAFANVLLALSALLDAAHAPLKAEIARQVQYVGMLVSSLEDGLAENEAYLEPAGAEVYLTLRNELRARVRLPRGRPSWRGLV